MNDENQKQVSRRRYWSELTLEEKVERMRDEVKDMKITQFNHADTLQDFMYHSHKQDGTVVSELLQRPTDSSRWERGDDVYF